jgi:hypothetical protein
MDWNLAIERHREPLLVIVAALFAKIGLTENGTIERLSRPLYRAVLSLLQPAEAAVRRLIIIMARDIKVEPRSKRPMPKGLFRSRKVKFQSNGQGLGKAQGEGKSHGRPPSFNLFDRERRSDAGKPRRRRRRTPKVGPRVHFFGYDPRIPEFLRGPDPTPAPVVEPDKAFRDGTVSAIRLCRRLFAIMWALKNLEREAKRYSLWLARPVEDRCPRRERALKFGWPPGWRARPTHEVHEILKECHWLIRELPEPNTS